MLYAYLSSELLLREASAFPPNSNIFPNESPNIHWDMRRKFARLLYILKCIIQRWGQQIRRFRQYRINIEGRVMNDQTITAEATTKPKSRWRWWKVLLIICGSGWLILGLLNSYRPVQLGLRTTGAFTGDDGRAIQIVNNGEKPITITSMTVNDRDDCKVTTPAQEYDRAGRAGSLMRPDAANDAFKGSTLKVGDTATYISSCRVVRATVETDLGSATYTFNR